MPDRNPGPAESYRAVEIRVFPGRSEEAEYPVALRVAGGPEFQGRLRLDKAALLAKEASPKDYGLALGQALFGDDALGDGYQQAMANAQRLRVRLQIDPPELLLVRWERLYHPLAGRWLPLGSTGDTPFSRYVPVQRWGRPSPVTQRPLRLLAVIASPADLDDYKLDPIPDEERDALHGVLDGLPGLEVTYLESGSADLGGRAQPPTLNRERQALELAFLEGLTQVEVAERTGLPLGTTKARIRRGMISLRRHLPQRLAA